MIDKHMRFIRMSYIVGWEATGDGLLLMYSDGSREMLRMSVKDAEENSAFLAGEISNERDVVGIVWSSEEGTIPGPPSPPKRSLDPQ